MKLSLCMIVKNEEDTLCRALSTASIIADEIIIVDTGSTDGTKKAALSFTDKVYDFKWCDDFSAARNFAISKASCDYYMWLDADDVIPAETAKKLRAALAKLKPDIDMIMLPYVIDVDEAGNPTFSYYRERVMRNSPEYYFRGRVHEAVPLRGKTVKLPFAVFHKKPHGRESGSRNLDIYEKMRSSGIKLEPRETYYYARELFYNGKFADAANAFEEFLTAGSGFIPNCVDSCIMLSRCYSRLGQNDKALSSLYRSFVYGLPTGEAACEIGLTYFARNDYRSAAYWFEIAAKAKPDLNSGAFVDINCYGFLPNVWLTVCYDRLGDIKKAYKRHLRAEKLRPDHPSIVANRKYFDGIKANEKIHRR